MAAGFPHMGAYPIPSGHVVPIPFLLRTRPALTLYCSAGIPLANSAFLSVSLSSSPPDPGLQPEVWVDTLLASPKGTRW